MTTHEWVNIVKSTQPLKTNIFFQVLLKQLKIPHRQNSVAIIGAQLAAANASNDRSVTAGPIPLHPIEPQLRLLLTHFFLLHLSVFFSVLLSVGGKRAYLLCYTSVCNRRSTRSEDATINGDDDANETRWDRAMGKWSLLRESVENFNPWRHPKSVENNRWWLCPN